MDYGMKYEMVIRKVFNCERWGDPAKQANADNFTEAALRDVKTMLSYSTLFLERKFSNKEDVLKLGAKLHKKIAEAKSVSGLHSVVDDLLSKL